MRDLHVAASRGGIHCVLHATVSRGCPGEPDDPICTPIQGREADTPLEKRIEAALAVAAVHRRSLHADNFIAELARQGPPPIAVVFGWMEAWGVAGHQGWPTRGEYGGHRIGISHAPKGNGRRSSWR